MGRQPDTWSGGEARGQRGKPRLGTALLAGSGLVASALYVDGMWGRIRWPSSQSRLVGASKGDQELALTCSGLGSTDGRRQSQHARRFLPGKPAYWEYSNDRISVSGLAQVFRQQASDARLVHLNGHSMGGPVGLEMLRQAAIQGLKLGKVVLNCSPFDRDDVRLGRAAALLKVVKWPVGPGNKFALSLTRGLLEHKQPGRALIQAGKDCLTGGSPRLWLSQVKTMGQVGLAANIHKLEPLIGPETEVVYCRPEDPAQDPVVATVQASQKYGASCEGLGLPFREFLIPGAGHADSDLTFTHLARSRPTAA